jgi:hypothetical protein
MTLIHICENCGKTAILDSVTAFMQGWDYPPHIGAFGVVSPRTCGNCLINTTLWWEIAINNTPVEELSPRHRDTLIRILFEPESITPLESKK